MAGIGALNRPYSNVNKKQVAASAALPVLASTPKIRQEGGQYTKAEILAYDQAVRGSTPKGNYQPTETEFGELGTETLRGLNPELIPWQQMGSNFLKLNPQAQADIKANWLQALTPRSMTGFNISAQNVPSYLPEAVSAASGPNATLHNSIIGRNNRFMFFGNVPGKLEAGEKIGSGDYGTADLSKLTFNPSSGTLTTKKSDYTYIDRSKSLLGRLTPLIPLALGGAGLALAGGLGALGGAGAAAGGGGAAAAPAAAGGSLGTGLTAGGGATGLTAGAGGLMPAGLAFAPAAAPAATIGGGALGGGLTAGAGALMPSFAGASMAIPSIIQSAAPAGGAAGGTGLTPGAAGVTGLTPGAGGVTGLTPSAAALSPEFAGAGLSAPSLLQKAATPGPGTAAKGLDGGGSKGGGSVGGVDVMNTLRDVASIANILTPVAALAAGGAALGESDAPPIPDVGKILKELPAGVVQPIPDIPKPEEILVATKPDVIKAARARRGRSSTMLTQGTGVPFESFGGPSTPFYA